MNRLVTAAHSLGWAHGTGLKGWRQCAAALVLLGFAGACGGGPEPTLDLREEGEFLGGVTGDEPRAVLVAWEILAAEGNAADAAVALYFTAAVTYPVAASLGGGGVCLVYDRSSDTVQALDFLPDAPAGDPPPGTWAAAVPGAVRGMYALNTRYGRLRWGRLLVPAERIARFGHPVSRALARRLAEAGPGLLERPDVASIFARSGGGALDEGENIVQLDLAVLLGRVRTRGPGDFYTGALARSLVEGVRAAGGWLTVDDLRAYRPRWRETVDTSFRSARIHTSPPPAVGGITALQIWRMLAVGKRYRRASAEERPHLLAEAAMRAFRDRAAWLRPGERGAEPPADLLSEARARRLMADYRPDERTPAPGAFPDAAALAGANEAMAFVVVDREGSAVACVVSLFEPFGAGRVAPGTGIVLAAAPGPAGRDPAPLAPVLIVNHNTRQVLFAAAASGGAPAATSLAATMVKVLVDERPLMAAVAAPRLHRSGLPDVVLVEVEMGEQSLAELAARGHVVQRGPPLGRVHAIHCPGGLERSPESCSFTADRRGFGLATGGGF